MVQKLLDVIRDTEGIYLDLANSYPQLLSELENNIRETTRHLKELSGGASSRDDNLETKIISLLDNTSKLVYTIAGSFEDLYKKDEELFSSIDRGIDSLSNLEEIIVHIRQDSSEMELISLNAMTVAIKAGNQGRGFSFITEELQKLSAQTISYTEMLTKKGKNLLDRFQHYKDHLGRVRNAQGELTHKLQKTLKDEFAQFAQGVKGSMETLSELTAKSRSVRTPLLSIMQEIQLQDLIKQSIDHVILSLEELEKYQADNTSEAKLDELTFVKLLPDLCINVLEDVNTKIKDSMEVFEKNTDNVHAIVTEVQHQRDIFKGDITNEKTQTLTLQKLFADASQRLNVLIRDIDRSMDQKKAVAAEGKSLMKEVQLLEDSLNSFSSLVRRFHNINVASRIEVAKQSVLREMNDTVQEMTILTDKIEGDIEEALTTTRQFIETTYNNVYEYSLSFTNQRDEVDEFEFQIERSRGRLAALQDSILRVISGFSFFSESFTSMLLNTTHHLKGLQELVLDIEDIQYTLRDIEENASTRLQHTLTRMKKDDWVIHSKKLQEIIERFTIFTHKQTAGAIGGFAVEEEAAKSGEITLF